MKKLPTKDRLTKFGIIMDQKWCFFDQDETMKHLFFSVGNQTTCGRKFSRRLLGAPMIRLKKWFELLKKPIRKVYMINIEDGFSKDKL